MTPGYKTTEFWVSILIVASATALALADKIAGTTWQQLAAAIAGIYTLARTSLKKTSNPDYPNSDTQDDEPTE